MGEEKEMRRRNGRTRGGGRGGSVIDYVVGDEEVWEKVSRIRVEDRIDSDHFLVMVEIK